MNIHWDQAMQSSASAQPGILGDHWSASHHPPAGRWTDGPEGQGAATHRREHGFGLFDARNQLPPNGTPKFELSASPQIIGAAPYQFGGHTVESPTTPNLGSLPKLHFPTFDGDNPRLWISRSKDYFDLYGVGPSMWIWVSVQHFSGPAARWWLSVERKLKGASWREFSTWMLEHFGRDQHEQLIRQLFHIHQTSKVALYIEQFSELIDKLSAYENKTDPMFYTLHFIDGLKDTIKSNVLLHRPSTLDTVSALAQLQEEVMEPTRSEVRKPVYARGPSPAQHPLPLPRPPAPVKFTSEAGKGTRSTDDKLSSLKVYRRACGLCDKCTEKWFHGHRCAPTVQLQVLEEMWELMHEPVEQSCFLRSCFLFLRRCDSTEPDNKSISQELLSVSVSAVSELSSPHTVQLQGTCQGHSISILVDSGSSLSFINTSLAAQLSGVSLMPSPVTVKLADGGHI
jgi:hypothetical protein